jgi:hypothetical protein
MTLSITVLCPNAECHILFNIMLSVVRLNVIMLNVVAPMKTPRLGKLRVHPQNNKIFFKHFCQK